MRLRPAEHEARPWRIHELAPDFEVEDVWAIGTTGGPDDFTRLVAAVWSSFDRPPSGVGRLLLAARRMLGEWFGWDRTESGLGARVASLSERRPADMRDGQTGLTAGSIPFTPLYLLPDEWAAEIANETMHGVVHLGWVPTDAGTYRGQMAILVKRNGRLGRFYLAAIKPFRHLFYPRWIRTIEREWSS